MRFIFLPWYQKGIKNWLWWIQIGWNGLLWHDQDIPAHPPLSPSSAPAHTPVTFWFLILPVAWLLPAWFLFLWIVSPLGSHESYLNYGLCLIWQLLPVDQSWPEGSEGVSDDYRVTNVRLWVTFMLHASLYMLLSLNTSWGTVTTCRVPFLKKGKRCKTCINLPRNGHL